MNENLKNPEVRASFEQDMANLLPRLEAGFAGSIASDTISDLAALAHTLRGAAAMVELEALRIACEDLQRVIEVAASFVGTAPRRAQEIFDFCSAKYPAALRGMLTAHLAGNDGDALRQQRKLGRALRRKWAGYFHDEQAESGRVYSDEPEEDVSSAANRFLASVGAGEEERGASVPVSPASAAPAGDSAVDPEMLGYFVLEAGEALEQMEQAALRWEQAPADADKPSVLFRLAHTVKGAANSIGLTRIGTLMHALEDMLEEVVEGRDAAPPATAVPIVLAACDAFRLLMQEAEGRRNAAQNDPVFEAALARIRERRATVAPVAAKPAEPLPAAALVPVEASPEAASTSEAADSQTIRVNSTRLDQLLNLVGELVVSRTRLDKKISDIESLKEELNLSRGRLIQVISDFQGKYEYSGRQQALRASVGGDTTSADWKFSDLEFDRYDDFNILARSLMEIGTDTTEIIGQLDRFFRSFSDETAQFSKITTGLQDEITRIRMVPLAPIFRRLQRASRDAAAREGKLVSFEAAGGEVSLDKAIADRVFTPLIHLVRNAVSHGIESAETRRAAGKTPGGRIALRAYADAGQVVIEIADDGRGLDFQRIRQEGISRGLLAPTAMPDEAELQALIFQPGFSTAGSVSDISGRGIGMDVVRQELDDLGGSIELQTRAGEGCVFTLRLPLTLSINQAMMVSCAGETFALPLNFVERVIECSPSQVMITGDNEVLAVEGELLSVTRLDRTLGIGGDRPSAMGAAVIIRMAGRRLVLLVDRVLRKQEIVAKPLGLLLAGRGPYSGATLTGEGRVVLILDVPKLSTHSVGAASASSAPVRTDRATLQGTSAGKRAPVLVVDDSLSVRKVAEKYLSDLGVPCASAIDGLDALEKLRAGTYSMVITDLEMPRLHGLELIAEIRRQPALAHLPVVVVTSRDAERHRARAREAGANDYLIKPFSREQIGACINRLADQPAGGRSG